MYGCIHTYIYIYTHIHKCINIYIYTYIYIYKYTHTHTSGLGPVPGCSRIPRPIGSHLLPIALPAAVAGARPVAKAVE